MRFVAQIRVGSCRHPNKIPARRNPVLLTDAAYCAVQPPSITRSVPFIKLAASEHN
jgi:hypothetical protein